MQGMALAEMMTMTIMGWVAAMTAAVSLYLAFRTCF